MKTYFYTKQTHEFTQQREASVGQIVGEILRGTDHLVLGPQRCRKDHHNVHSDWYVLVIYKINIHCLNIIIVIFIKTILYY